LLIRKNFNIRIVLVSIIEINDLVKKYKKKKDTSNEYKLSIKNLVIERGKIFGLLGPNGSGKSTLIKLVLDLIFPDAGLITIFGISNKLKESRNFVGYLPENFSFPHDYSFEQAAYYFGIMNKYSKKEVISELSKLYVELELTSILGKRVKELSKGMIQNLGLVNALVGQKKLLILDEPFNGFDPIQKRRVMKYLSKQNEDNNLTILFTSHILSDVEVFCNQVALIKNGEILNVTSKKNVFNDYGTIENYYFKYFDITGETSINNNPSTTGNHPEFI